jgi:hypothetical protein
MTPAFFHKLIGYNNELGSPILRVTQSDATRYLHKGVVLLFIANIARTPPGQLNWDTVIVRESSHQSERVQAASCMNQACLPPSLPPALRDPEAFRTEHDKCLSKWNLYRTPFVMRLIVLRATLVI